VSSCSDVAVVTVPGESAGPTLLDRSRSPQLNSQFPAVRPPLFSLVASFQPTFDSHTKIDSQSGAHFDIIHRSSSSTSYKTSLQNTVHISCRTLCHMNTIHWGMRTGVVTSCICHLLKGTISGSCFIADRSSRSTRSAHPSMTRCLISHNLFSSRLFVLSFSLSPSRADIRCRSLSSAPNHCFVS
jgi:hypothetical protein